MRSPRRCAAPDVPFGTVKATSDPTHGTLVDVSLAEGADPELARRVLGQFPFQFRLTQALGCSERA